MFFSLKNSVASLLAFSALAQATITITNFSVVGNGTSSITWTSSDPDTDPTLISLSLTNPNFHTQFAVGTNIPTSQGTQTFETPGLIPGPDYTFVIFNIANNSDIFAQTNSFTVTEHDATSSTTSAASSTSGSSTSPSISGTTTGVPATSSSSGSASSSGSGSSSTSAPSASSTSPSSSASNSGTGTSSSSASGSSASVFGSGGNGAAGLNVPASGMTLLAFLGGLVGLLA